MDLVRKARSEDNGSYLLRADLPGCDPKTLWKTYMFQSEIEPAFFGIKDGLGLRLPPPRRPP